MGDCFASDQDFQEEGFLGIEEFGPNASTTGMTDLGPEVLLVVFQYLNPREVIRMGEVCRTWRSISYSIHLWADLRLNEWPKKQSTGEIPIDDNRLFGALVRCMYPQPPPMNYAGLCRWLRIVRLPRTGSAVTDIGVQLLAQLCPYLQELYASWSNITDAALNNLAVHCQNLQKLDVSWASGISDTGISFIAQGCTRLTFLHIHGCPITHVGFAFLAQRCLQLVELGMSHSPALDIRAAHALRLIIPRLTHFDVSHPPLPQKIPSDAFLSIFQHLPMPSPLRSLKISACAHLSVNLVALLAQRCPHLTYLDISRPTPLSLGSAFAPGGSQISPYGFSSQHLQQQPPQQQQIMAAPINDETFPLCLRAWPRLVHLDLTSWVSLHRPCFATLPFILQHMTHLDLHGCSNIHPNSLVELAPFVPNLRTLALSDTTTTDNALYAFATCCLRLRTLDLSGCTSLTSSGFGCLNNLNDLRRLRLHLLTTVVTDESIISFLASVPYLDHLSLHGCIYLTDASLCHVARSCPRLRFLDLSGCSSITDNGLIPLVSTCTSLTRLYLAGCPSVTDASLKYIAQYCSELESLTLYGCDLISDEAVMEVSHLLPNLETLRTPS